MPIELSRRVPDAAEIAALDPQHIAAMLQGQAQTIDMLRRQLDWFKRQLFGPKSERVVSVADPQQMHLGELLGQTSAVPPGDGDGDGQHVPAHTRRKRANDFTDDGANVPFFDASKVPVQTIDVPNPEAQGLLPGQYEVIGHKVSHRLAQRPGSFVVLKYVRPVIKRHDSKSLHCPPAPAGSSRAAVPT